MILLIIVDIKFEEIISIMAEFNVIHKILVEVKIIELFNQVFNEKQINLQSRIIVKGLELLLF